MSSANPTSATNIAVNAQALIGPAPTAAAVANAKGEANTTVTITYSFWERIFLWFGIEQRLTAAFSINTYAFVNVGPNQITIAVFLLGGPQGTTDPIRNYQVRYNFEPQRANRDVLDVKKDGATVKSIGNPGMYRGSDPGRTVAVRPGTYDLKFELNAVVEADGQVIVGAEVNLSLT